MKKHERLKSDYYQDFTPREMKHFTRHGPTWEYHYKKETRKRIGFGLILAMVALATAAVIYLETHLID